ncbi:MAG: PilZ domain-containing protein, partial [Pseudomonadota bacterium]
DALTEVRANKYSLVFLEIGIADGMGKSILEAIGRHSPSTCVVVMSAGITNGEVENTIIESDYYFLPKPFEVLQVRTMASRILGEISRRNGVAEPLSDHDERKKRSTPRHSIPGSVTIFSDSERAYPGIPPEFDARIVDLSSGGIGVQTDLPLPPGQVFHLDRDEERKKGVVRWSMVFENRFRAGLQFI